MGAADGCLGERFREPPDLQNQTALLGRELIKVVNDEYTYGRRMGEMKTFLSCETL